MSKMNADVESNDSSNTEVDDYEDLDWSSDEEDNSSDWDDEDDSEDDVSDGGATSTPTPIDVPWTSAGIPRPSFPFTGNSGV